MGFGELWQLEHSSGTYDLHKEPKALHAIS
jgi:hypothetical protein